MRDAATRKKELRAAIKSRLETLTRDRYQCANLLYDQLKRVDRFRDANVVGLYVDFKSEAPTRPFIPRLFDPDERLNIQTVAVPYCVGLEMRFYKLLRPEFDPETGEPRFADLKPFPPFGILEPSEERRLDERRYVAPEKIDLLIAPGLGFDAAGRRLGRGSGYYDRYIPLLRPDALLIGLCFDEQLFDEIPANRHDKPVDVVVTPTRIIATARRRVESQKKT